MLKALFNKKSKTRDLRFVDSESYANRQPFPLSKSEDDTFIRVEPSKYQKPTSNNVQESSFLEHIKQVTSQQVFVEEMGLDEEALYEEIELGLPQSNVQKNNAYGFDFDEVASNDLKQLSGLGVFSDSKIYSALIHSVLSDYHLNIQHFNHPSTFKPERFELFDSVSAWIVFLSDDSGSDADTGYSADSDFLDLFIDRYVDKPTLFLFSKLNKDACIKRINQFIHQHSLHIPQSQTFLHELEY